MVYVLAVCTANSANSSTTSAEDEFDETEFFQYRGVWYSVSDFIRVVAAPHEHLYGWDGYSSDSYFSGVVIKYCYDGTVIVGTYFS